MMYRLSTLDFHELPGIPEMLTLTYPADFPVDGRIVKRHLFMFRRAWFRRFGAQPIGVWKLEFQRRGAPHFHLYVGRPVMPWREFLWWARMTWYRIVASGDEKHLDQGVRLDRQFVSAVRSKGKIAGYFAKHNAKGTKSYQNRTPEGFESVGRWWGYWGMTVHGHEVEISSQQLVEFRRLLAKLRKARTGRKVRVPGRLIGSWAMSRDGYALLAQMLSRDGPAMTFVEWARRYDPSPALRVQTTV